MNKVFCGECGIAEKVATGQIRCVKFGFKFGGESADAWRECSYFSPVMLDDGEPLDSYETLAIKEAEMASRRFKGPV